MKKLSILFLALVLTLGLGITAFAEDYTVPSATEFAGADEYTNLYTATLSEDLQTLYMDGNSYSLADISILELEYNGWEISVELTAVQRQTIKKATAITYGDDDAVQVTLYMTDGIRMTVTFLRDDLRGEYDRLTAGDADRWVLDFEWPERNTVTADKAQLKGESTVVTLEDVYSSVEYPVFAYTAGGTLVLKCGVLLNLDGSYIYVPYPDDLVDERYPYILETYLETAMQVPAVKLTDPTLVQQLDKAQQAYYNDGLGFMYNDTLTENISDVFLVLLFAIIPGAIAVLFLILSLRAKKPSYKKLFWVTCVLSAAELAVFIAIANMLV